MNKGRNVYLIMKKVSLSIICGFLLLGFVAGCGSKKPAEEKKESLKISLDSNSSTGYSWSYKVSNDDIIDISEKYDDSNCPPDKDGCGGQMVYTVKASKPGKTTITFEYSFATPEERPSKTAIYDITVNDDYSITEEHHGTYFDEE